MTDVDAIIGLIESQLTRFYSKTKSKAGKLVISHDVANHILHISQSLSRSRGHVTLIGESGSGRHTCAKLSASLLDYEIYQVLGLFTFHYFLVFKNLFLIFFFQVQIGRNYVIADWWEDIKQLVRKTGVHKTKTMFLCSATKFPNKMFFDHLTRLISTSEILELFNNEERIELIELYVKTNKDSVIKHFNSIFSQF